MLGFSCLKVAWWLYIGRLLLGCGMGLLSYVVNYIDFYFVVITIQTILSHFEELQQIGSSLFILGTGLYC